MSMMRESAAYGYIYGFIKSIDHRPTNHRPTKHRPLTHQPTDPSTTNQILTDPTDIILFKGFDNKKDIDFTEHKQKWENVKLYFSLLSI